MHIDDDWSSENLTLNPKQAGGMLNPKQAGGMLNPKQAGGMLNPKQTGGICFWSLPLPLLDLAEALSFMSLSP